jgi:hypothetical protein
MRFSGISVRSSGGAARRTENSKGRSAKSRATFVPGGCFLPYGICADWPMRTKNIRRDDFFIPRMIFVVARRRKRDTAPIRHEKTRRLP